MKKIILAVASVLALGMLVSCKQEVSGNLTVTDIQYNAFQTTTETYYYKVEGSAKIVTEQVSTSKESASASEVKEGTSTTTQMLDVDSSNPVVTVSVSKDPSTNVTTYTIGVPALKGKSENTWTMGSVKGSNYTSSELEATRKTITQIGSTFYYNNANGEKVVIEGFDPTAASFELAKLSEKDKTTSTNGDRRYTADGDEWYASKTVTTITPTYSLTYTKL